jgi:hypothetical protein
MEFQDLTDEEIVACNHTFSSYGFPCVFLYEKDMEEGGIEFARAVIAKFIEKNAARQSLY